MSDKIKKIIFIIGKSRSGKDTIAKYLKKNFDIEPIVSYTTRPKRDNETDGVEHHFISTAEMNDIKEKGNMIAYTINETTGIEYCATSSNLLPDKWYSYIINPEGLRYFLANNTENIYFYTVYIDCDEEILSQRGLERGDSPERFAIRIESERKEFEYFRDEYSKLINWKIDVSDLPYKDMSKLASKVSYLASSAFNMYLKYSHDIRIINAYNECDPVVLFDLNGKKIHKKCTVEKILDDGRLFKECYYVLKEYPDTIVRECSMTKYKSVLSELIGYISGIFRHNK